MKAIKKIEELINNLGFQTETTMNTQLRYSWYVGKLLELGYNPNMVNHIDVSCGGFIAQLDDDLFCSGANIMIQDALNSIGWELGIEEPYLLIDNDVKLYNESDDNENDYLYIFTLENFENFMKKVAQKVAY